MSFHDMDTLLDWAKLKEALKRPLPGKRAHRTMVPPGRPLELRESEYSTALPSAVMVLLFREGDTVFVCLTKRSSHLKHHAGQISFPGGKQEPWEAFPSEAALREAQEEIGIQPQQVFYAGLLSELHIPVSGFVVQPVVFWAPSKPSLNLNAGEVDKILLLPVSLFLNKQNIGEAYVETRQGQQLVPCYVIDNEKIWGATAMMLAELAMVLNRASRIPKATH